MCGGRDLAVDSLDFSFGVYDESCALGAHVFFAIHAFFDPDAIGFDDGAGFVAEEREGEGMLGREFRVALRRIDTDAENHGVFREDFGVPVADAAGLDGAAGSVVLGVKIEDDFFAAKAGEADGLAFSEDSADGGGGEIGGGIAGLEFGFHTGNKHSSARGEMQGEAVRS